jgi:hypothetical protein
MESRQGEFIRLAGFFCRPREYSRTEKDALSLARAVVADAPSIKFVGIMRVEVEEERNTLIVDLFGQDAIRRPALRAGAGGPPSDKQEKTKDRQRKEQGTERGQMLPQFEPCGDQLSFMHGGLRNTLSAQIPDS